MTMADTPQDAETAAREALRVAESALECCYDVVQHPGDGTSCQDQALKQVRAALALRPASSPGEVTWQPIATAPKTSWNEAGMTRAVCVLGWCPDSTAPDGGDQKVVWWEPKYKGGCWTSDGDMVERPTLWRPLPAPPTLLSTTQTEAGNGR